MSAPLRKGPWWRQRCPSTFWESTLQDVQLAARRIRKSPGFTLVVSLTAALGITVSTLVFVTINACWLRPLPHILNPQELAFVHREFATLGDQRMGISYQDFLEIRERTTTMVDVAAVIPEVDFIVRIGGGTEREIVGAEVSDNYFQVLGRRLEVGGGLLLDDPAVSDDNVVIGHGLWQREFGGDASVLGETMHIDGSTYTIVGVAPQSSSWGMVSGTMEAGVWIPIKQRRRDAGDQANLSLVGRRRGGLTVERVQAELDAIGPMLAALNPEQWEDHRSGQQARIVALTDLQARLGPLDGNLVPSLIFWFVLVGLTMLVTCSNVATLLLNRALRRRTEIATRLALGSGRGRLVRQLLIESTLLFSIAGILSLLFIHWQTQLLATGRSFLPFTVDVTVDPWVVLFAAAVTVGSGVFFGLAPALQASRPDLMATLKGTAKTVRFRRFGARNLFVLTQVAGSMVLVAVSALVARDIQRVDELDVGFAAENVGVLSLDLSLRDYESERGRQFLEDLTEKCEAIVGVEAVAIAGWVPLSENQWTWGGLVPEGYEIGPNESVWANYNPVTPGYFDFMGMPILRGRDFTDQDDGNAPSVMIVNQAFADRFWPDQEPVGRRVAPQEGEPPTEIIGVVRDAKYTRGDFVDERSDPHFWLPRAQLPSTTVEFHFKTVRDPAPLFGLVREKVRLLDSNLPIKSIERIESITAAALLEDRIVAATLGGFGLVTLFLAVMGIYAVIAYAVLGRTRELGIRLALGARPAKVVGMVVLESLSMSAAGIVTGLVLAALVARGIRTLLLGIGRLDPASYLGSIVLLVLAAVTASLIPALRAGRLDPVLSLKSE